MGSFNADQATAMANHGKIRFATCSCTAYVPVSNLIRLLREDGNGQTGVDWKGAVHKWFFAEICSAVGGHSIL